MVLQEQRDLPAKTCSLQMPAMRPGALFLHIPRIFKTHHLLLLCVTILLQFITSDAKTTPSFSISSPNKVPCPADFIPTIIFQFGSYYQCPISFPNGLSAQPFQQTPAGSPLSSHSILQSFQPCEEASTGPLGGD